MKRFASRLKLASLFLMPFFFSACLSVYVTRGDGKPLYHWKKAEREIERIHLRFPQRKHRAHRLHILVFDKDSGELVKVSAPLWLVRACLDLGFALAHHGSDPELEEIENKYRIEWRSLRDLGKLGPGLLVEVMSEDEQILIWLR
ncbi:MAG: hypothetical protein ACE5LC_02285 [Candidatus Aminicenantales bacterium]